MFYGQIQQSGHVAIYLGNGKRVHSTPGSGLHINKAKADKIFHFTALPKDPKAYFDPETGILHSTKTSSSSDGASTTGSSSTASASTSESSTSSSSTSGSSTSSSSTSNSSSTASTPSVSGFDIVKEAKKYVGHLNYVPGGQSLVTGADCSGFAWAILYNLNLIHWARTNDVGFRNKGTEVKDLSQAEPGDILCFNGHIAIYAGKKGEGLEGTMIEALGTQYGVTDYRKVKDEKSKLMAIRRFTNSTSSTTETTQLGPVNTDEIFGQFSQQTRQIILEHRNDFNVNNFKSFFTEHNYTEWVKSLGGVFEKYAGRDNPTTVTDAGTFQEVAEYTWGLFSIYGFDYDSGKSYHHWGANNKQVAESAFYSDNRRGSHSTGHIDDICSDLGRINKMRTNCNYGSNAFLQKCGLTDDKNFTTHKNRGQLIEKSEDLKIGDLVHFFDSSGEWHHVAVVGEIDPELGPILYDSGNRFIRTGNYKFALNGGSYKNYHHWTGRRFFDINQDTSGQIGTTNNNSDSNTKYTYKVKVATWEENSKKIDSTDKSEKLYERNYSMNPKTIPYREIISQYRMPFNYLWAMLITSRDKDYVFDLADLVKNSKIEITIHDNYQESKTVTTNKKKYEYFYSGKANAKFKYSYTTDSQNNLLLTEPKTINSEATLKDEVTAETTKVENYKKTTTVINKTNTLDVALTLADSWWIKYERKYIYNELTDLPELKSTDGPYTSEDSESFEEITNSELKNIIINEARAKAKEWLSKQAKDGTVTDIQLTNQEQTNKCKTTEETTIITNTSSSSYTPEPEKDNDYTEDAEGRQRFVDVYIKYPNARTNIINAWLFEILESNQDTVNMVDLTKYLFFRATGEAIDDVTDVKAVLNKLKQNYTDVSQGGTSGENGGTTGGTSGIDGIQGQIYDFLLSKGIPSIGVAAIMGNIENESSFSTTIVNSSGHSGLCQWGGGRIESLKKYATSKGKEWTDLNIQLEFLWSELNSSYTNVKDIIMSANTEEDLEYATWYWGTWYEVYDSAHDVGYEASRQWAEEKERYASAQKWYNSWKQNHMAGGGSGAGTDIPTDVSYAILEKANANSTPWPGEGLCLKWVDDVYSNAGILLEKRENTAFDAWKANGISTDKNNIPIGAAVYGTGHNSNKCGHVGIYIGNGKVVDSVGKSIKINTSTLTEWISWQTDVIEGHQGWLGWGWEDGNRTRGLK